ncbi:MAG: RagB/SusD family nutrient uptake outer membrane protein [Dyadobacter sp. 50-39]|uniref:RagB/SusD family nutrient uptake outer membrane protein n=1 Tax=Dyadobacter sp. 50-39 TaxID=1895756 RepID=UPI00095EDDEE|nr:RagB/SusD family nutrient uptake outer membrane protein [Dyadobacter sp. 50-39]OJV15254.1 MAG: RagB/SusD family nutrient uptake outer membrane protein [Dyadobacter sp. 50-39]
MRILIGFLTIALLAGIAGCSTDLDTEPTNILPESAVFTDKALAESVLANFYASVNYGQNNGDYGSYHLLDEANLSYGPATTTDAEKVIPRDLFDAYDYELVRRMNQFLVGIRSSAARAALLESDRSNMEAQCIFLRAWYHFCMARSYGGMPILGDTVFTYESGIDPDRFQVARSTEAGIYDYVIAQCDLAAVNLTSAKTTNGGVANKWAALMLKARAAVYAASIANYGNKLTPTLRTQNWEAGIPADQAAKYYQIALETAEQVIAQSPYALQINEANLGDSFYKATSVKAGNTEVIWAMDRLRPNAVTQFTNFTMPYSHRDFTDGNALGVVLNLVEAFENKDGSSPLIKTTNADGSYVFYNSVEDPFTKKDARLWGTVIYPNAPYRQSPVILQAGQLNKSGNAYVLRTSSVGGRDAQGNLITSINGPVANSDNFVNKTGFLVRKFVDETPNAGLNPLFSEMWWPRFRIAEAYLIAAEAAFELGDKTKAVTHLNATRKRGGIQSLTAEKVTFEHIVNEYRVEFAFEDHRLWDLKRWRLAHKLWNGIPNDPTAQMYSLFPYKVVAQGDPNDGKWIFTKQVSFKMTSNPRNFPLMSYYAAIQPDWRAKNPKLVNNPLQ